MEIKADANTDGIHTKKNMSLTNIDKSKSSSVRSQSQIQHVYKLLENALMMAKSVNNNHLYAESAKSVHIGSD